MVLRNRSMLVASGGFYLTDLCLLVIIYLPGQPGDVLSPNPNILRRVVIIMSTYEELTLIVSIALLIVAILNLKNKK